jgi:hypothetical protein
MDSDLSEPESHGVIISELKARVRRVEQHLNLAIALTY